MKAENTVIVLTPPTAAAIAVVRLCGGGVAEFLGKRFSRPVVARRAVHGELRDGQRIVDDPVVVVADDFSWADLCLHGGAQVIADVLELARGDGFVLTDDPAAAFAEAECEMEREMLAALPLARTELGVRILLAQPAAWRETLKKELDVGAVLRDESLWWLLHPPQVAIVGEPNVGKSTLANRLFGRERSITADIPGTTRDWIGEMADVGGLAVVLVDTPGVRETSDVIEREAIARAGEKIGGSDLVLHVVDATRKPVKLDWPGAMVVLNKTDLPAAWDVSQLNAITVSARTGAGFDVLAWRICARFGLEKQEIARARWWTVRQKKFLERAVSDPAELKKLDIGACPDVPAGDK